MIAGRLFSVPYTSRMGKLLELAARVRTAVKLKRGQCENCFTPLRDDASSRYCSDQCEFEYRRDLIV